MSNLFTIHPEAYGYMRSMGRMPDQGIRRFSLVEPCPDWVGRGGHLLVEAVDDPRYCLVVEPRDLTPVIDVEEATP